MRMPKRKASRKSPTLAIQRSHFLPAPLQRLLPFRFGLCLFTRPSGSRFILRNSQPNNDSRCGNLHSCRCIPSPGLLNFRSRHKKTGQLPSLVLSTLAARKECGFTNRPCNLRKSTPTLFWHSDSNAKNLARSESTDENLFGCQKGE